MLSGGATLCGTMAVMLLANHVMHVFVGGIVLGVECGIWIVLRQFGIMDRGLWIVEYGL